MKHRSVFLLVTLLLVPMLPSVAADPLPFPIPPEDPANGGVPVQEVQKILKDLFPEDAPFEKNCVKTDSQAYRPDDYPGEPVTIDAGDDHVAVNIWSNGQRTTVKIETDCLGV